MASPSIKIDTLLRDLGWRPYDHVSVRFDTVLPHNARAQGLESDETNPNVTEQWPKGAAVETGCVNNLPGPAKPEEAIGTVRRLDLVDPDGGLFESVLTQLTQHEAADRFLLPAPIIYAIVEMVNPKLGETIADQTAGTTGFLAAAYSHIRLMNTAPDLLLSSKDDVKAQRHGWHNLSAVADNPSPDGDCDSPTLKAPARMSLRIGGLPPDGCDVVLANPPFAVQASDSNRDDEARDYTLTATVPRFVEHMLKCLKPGGRCGLIVPESALFRSAAPYSALRRLLVENNQIEAILSLPPGIFQSCRSVKTSVLLLTKGGATDRVLFLDAASLKPMAQQIAPVVSEDLKKLVEIYQVRDRLWLDWQKCDPKVEWTEQWWFADATTIQQNDFRLSAARYRPAGRPQIKHRSPAELLDELRRITEKINTELEDLALKLGTSAT